jgi:hypothetical protein
LPPSKPHTLAWYASAPLPHIGHAGLKITRYLHTHTHTRAAPGLETNNYDWLTVKYSSQLMTIVHGDVQLVHWTGYVPNVMYTAYVPYLPISSAAVDY